jgi:hypothetical protein
MLGTSGLEQALGMGSGIEHEVKLLIDGEGRESSLLRGLLTVIPTPARRKIGVTARRIASAISVSWGPGSMTAPQDHGSCVRRALSNPPHPQAYLRVSLHGPGKLLMHACTLTSTHDQLQMAGCFYCS